MHGLAEAAERSGVAVTYAGADGASIQVPEKTLRLILAALQDNARSAEEAPRRRMSPGTRAYLPPFLRDTRAWGISLQLYELRSCRNAGIGDFADLREFCRIAGALGADFVGCNPLHALFTAEPGRCSPFFPSNRRFLNPLYIAVDDVPGVVCSEEESSLAGRLRDLNLVDYESVCRLKMRLLRDVWRRSRDDPRVRCADYLAFRARAGEALTKHALFESLSRHFAERGHGAGWRNWPVSYRDCHSADVAAFARENAAEVDFHIWLQWIAGRQLNAAAAAALGAGMRIGLYLDLAVADAPDGSAAWSEPDKYLHGMKIGAPPDVFSADGQDWGLAPLSPRIFASGPGAEYYDHVIGSVMKEAGALRIDHAMSLARLFLVPEDVPARLGTYVRYPMQDALTALIAGSLRYETVVIGEDLGNVPEGFREAMTAAGILSYRVLCFEHRAAEFAPASSYPRLSLACVTTHDLPPLRAWWSAADIALRRSHSLIDGPAAVAQEAERRVLKAALSRALHAEDIGFGKMTETADTDETWRILAAAVHRFVARTPSLLVAVRLADMTGEVMPTNIPGTSASYPNWRPKSSVAVEAFARSPDAAAIARIMAEERPR